MAWSTPKTNWKRTDKFNISDYNRIKNNLEYVHSFLQELSGQFDIAEMGNDLTDYRGYWDVNMFNAFERNLKTINEHALNRDYGATKTFYENGLFIDADELNRIESSTLDIYGICIGWTYGIRKLPFRLGAFKARF